MKALKTQLLLSALPLALLACGDNGTSPESAAAEPALRNLQLAAAPPPDPISPARRIRRDGPPPPPPTGPADANRPQNAALDFRSIDGSDNNLRERSIGAAGINLLRHMPAAYADGVATPAGADRPNPRAISNAVSDQTRPVPIGRNWSDYLWQWGQFLDHDIDLTDGADPAEAFNIAVPVGDEWFDPDATGTVEMAFNRSVYDPNSGITGPRQQRNEITAWIDASNVYGSNPARALALRAADGSGRLRISAGGFLPFNTQGLSNAGGDSPRLFLAGDVRANEQTGLIAMHTLFVREHNRWVAVLSRENPQWDGERLYQEARRLVGAEMQHITYREFLPALLGRNALPPYAGYDDSIDASIANSFAGAAYRLGHSMLTERILRLDENKQVIPQGHLALRDAFFNPARITDEGGIEPVLRGLAAQRSSRIDHLVVDEVRNFLFGPPGAGGFDLVALNIQRGRDHGLPDYNSVRELLGMPRLNNVAELNPNPEIRQRLEQVYQSPGQIDLWVGGLAEPHVAGSEVGAVFQAILVDQFRRLRDGDRYWYQRSLSPETVARVEALRLSDIIRLNTSIGTELADDVFRVPPPPQ